MLPGPEPGAGRVEVAELQRTIIADPNAALATARQLLASDPAAAEVQTRHLLASHPDHPVLLRLLAQALRRLDRAKEAADAESRAIQASIRNPAHRSAAMAIQAGDIAQAKAILQRLLNEDPNDVLALTMLGLHWSTSGEFEMAETLLRRATALAPADASTRMALAELLVRSKRAALALAELDKIEGNAAESDPVLSLRAECLGALGRLEEELAILERLTASRGQGDITLSLRTGHAQRALGQEAKAAATYRDIIRRHPGEGTSWWSLANLKTIKFDDSDVAEMKAALTLPDRPVQNRIRLNFALGKANEDRRDTEAAFSHYAEGNRLRSTIAPYDPQMIGKWVDRSIDLFTPGFFAARAGQGSTASDPIFIVGLQRSGSTLIEQILASHPAIEGTAELPDMPNLVRSMGETAAGEKKTFEDYFSGLDPERLQGLGQSYLDASAAHRRTDRPNFTDKMPNNWMYLGIIRTILPNARIVDVRRDPMACCFSNWKQLYAQGLDHSNALGTMGQFYVDYVRMMRHFDAVQPGRVHRIIYDDLVDDLDGEVRRLLDYLGLPFDPACLAFHSNERAVHTISAGQVRKPINRDGIGQWTPFDQWLGPLRDALGDVLTSWRT